MLCGKYWRSMEETGTFLGGKRSSYEHSSEGLTVTGNVRSCFRVNNCLRQGNGMSPWLFNIYLSGVLREAYESMLRREVQIIYRNIRRWLPRQALFALVTEPAYNLQCSAIELGRVCERRNSIVPIRKSKVIVEEGKRLNLRQSLKWMERSWTQWFVSEIEKLLQ